MSENEKGIIAVGMGERGVSLKTIDEAWRFCKAIEQSGVAPKDMNTAAKIFAVVQAGAELGLTPFRALSNMKIINGRVGPMGALAKALVRREKILAHGTGFKQDFIGEEGSDEFAARIVTIRDDEKDPYITIFSVKDAKVAGLWGKKSRDGKPGPWCLYPKRMLTWRAVGFHMDDYYSDVLMGMHIAEVLGDYPEEEIGITATMEPVAEPTRDPLLDELELISHSMQPPEGAKEDPNPDPTPHPIITDPIEVEGEKVDLETGEFQAPASKSPLEAVMQAEREVADKAAEQPPMTEEEAMRDLIEEGVLKEEDLAPANPGNATPEGEDDGLGF
jgi:hypothetical protein